MNSESVFCLGDFNCDMLDLNRPPKDGRDLADIMDVFDFENRIHEAIRITKTSECLLDLIITNTKSRVLQAGVVNPHISDHALVYVILRAFLPTSRSQKIHFRSLKYFNIDNFCSDLNDAPFITVMNCFEDVDDITFAFQSLYTAILDEHAPLKSVHVQGNQVPFMNESWRKAIRHRNYLWRMFTRDRTGANYAADKSERNICTSLRRNAIKEYFRKKSD